MKTGIYSVLLAGGLSLGLSFPALADISAQEVLDELVGYYESFGYEVNVGSQDMSGGTLTVTDLTLGMPLPEQDGQFSITIDTFGLHNTGNGSVEILIPAASVYGVKFTIDGNDVAMADIDVTTKGYSALVSGEVGDLHIISAIDAMSLKVSEVTAKGETVPVAIALNFGSMDVDYTIKKTDGERREVTSTFDVKSVDILANVKEPGGDGFFSLTADIADIVSSGMMSMNSFADMMATIEENPFAIFAGGMLVDADLQFGASHIDVAFQNRRDNFAMTASSTGGLLDGHFSPDLISYEIVQQGVDITVSSSEIPFPSVKVGYDELALSFAVPLAKSEEPSDFHLRTALRGLTIGEPIWAMFDPGQSIPRDPATVAIDLSGKMNVLVDLIDQETLENLDDMRGPPMLPVSLDLNELLVSVGGALLNGDGAVTFNFENPNMIAGMPLPAGEVNLSLKGGFGLMDKLAALGLIPPDASMGIRAMLGAFAKPVGDDHFETKVEITEEGAILANGQRIK